MRKYWLILLMVFLMASPLAEGVVINEIMYHPAGDAEWLEYVELYNEDVVPFDLGGWHFSDAMEFTFPEGMMMAPRSYLVVCKDPEAIRSTYVVDSVVGPFEGQLNNTGERIELANSYGSVMARVRYSDRYPWPAAADGTGHSLSLLSPYLPSDEHESWGISSVVGGTPGLANTVNQVIRRTHLVRSGDEWRYFKGLLEATKPIDAWRKFGFDDSGPAWLSGTTPMGFGFSDCGTLLEDMRGSYVSIFMRKDLFLEDPASVTTPILRIDYEDGFVAYLNGVEVARRMLGKPGSTVYYNTMADVHEAGIAEEIDVSGYISVLQAGWNVLAVQAHNSSSKSADFRIVPELINQSTVAVTDALPVVLNEIGTDGAGQTWVEIHNPSTKDIDVGGCHLSDDGTDLLKWQIPSGTVVQAGRVMLFAWEMTGISLPAKGGPVYLSSADGMRVLDAFAFAVESTDMSRGRYPDGGERWWTIVTPTPGEPNQVTVEENVVINEIMYHPPGGGEEGEYLELYNKGSYPVSLEGWRFSDGISYLFPSVTIPPDGYVVVAKAPQAIAEKYKIENVLGPFVGVLRNEGERIELCDALGNVVDEVHYYDGGRWPIWGGGGGSSLELIDPRQDNSVAPAWDASDETKEAEWKYYEYSGVQNYGESEFHMFLMHRGITYIDDIEFRDTAGNNLIKNGRFDSGATTWIIEGDHIQSRWVKEDFHSPPGCLKIVATGRGDTGVNRMECDLSSSLSSNRTYTVSFWAKWQRGINLVMTRTWNHGVARANRLETPERLGTPGKVNSVYRPNIGPVIYDVTQWPIVPKAQEGVRVRARVKDADGVSSVTLFHKADGTAEFTSAKMSDDGRHGDGEPGDGVYGAGIPGQADGRTMCFYISALDTQGASLTFPSDAPKRTAIYRVENSTAATNLNVYRLLMTAQNQGQLDSRPPLSNELLDATFVFNDSEIFYNVGMRYRGSPWGRPSRSRFRIAFNRDEPFHGVREINLDPNEGTKQRERFAFHLVRKMGAPAPYQKYVYFSLSGNYWGVMEDVQKVDKDFAAMWLNGDDGGTLYKVDDYFRFNDGGGFDIETAQLSYKGEDKESYRWNFKQRTNEHFDDYSDLIDLIKALDPQTTPDSDFEAAVEARIDTEEWLAVLATRTLIGDWDSLGYERGKNCYLYHAPVLGKWVMIPWDCDLVLESNRISDSIFHGNFPTIYRFVNWARYKRRYYGHLLELLNGPFSREEADRVLDGVYDVLRQEGVSPPSDIKTFLTGRRSAVIGQIPVAVLDIASGSVKPVVYDKPEVRLQGTAPVNAMRFDFNGIPFEPSWPNQDNCTMWSGTVGLEPGLNELILTAYDWRGRVIGTDNIRITYDPDLDGDKLRYLDEIAAGTDPNNSDTDGDLVTDYEEVKLAHTDPLDPKSTPHVVLETLRLPDGQVSISWQSLSGRYYQVALSSDMRNWVTLPGYIHAEQTTTTWIDGGMSEKIPSPAEPRVRWRFYRVILLPWDFVP